jgi:hypothetical protein
MAALPLSLDLENSLTLTGGFPFSKHVQTTLNGILYILQSFLNRSALRDAAGQRWTFYNKPAIFSFACQNLESHTTPLHAYSQ